MTKRIFAAIKINPGEDLLSIFYSLRNSLKEEKIKWVEPSNLHLTLKFFGETPVSQIEKINNVFLKISEEIAPFTISIDKTGIFGSSYNPRVIWFGFQEEELIKEIGNKIITVLNDFGFPSDRQNFVPHLTIGRVKKSIERKESFQNAINKYKNIKLNQIKVDHFTLYESILKPTGPVYIPLHNYQFGL